MPILEVTMFPEEGMDMRQLKEALRKKADGEVALIRLQSPGKIINWDARPNFSKLSGEGITLTWRYKQYKTKS